MAEHLGGDAHSRRLTSSLAARARTMRRMARPLAEAVRDVVVEPGRHTASQVLVPRYVWARQFGMTTANEQAYFEWYARRIYTGAGPIVDLGSWLGSTTIPLAVGLRKRRDVPYPIHAYDRFVWEPWMAETRAGAQVASRYHDGDLFVDAFRERVAPWSDLIDVHVADLATEQWDDDEIEFLLVDAMKNPVLADAIAREFFSQLRPGGHVLHQDFSHHFTPWIHVMTYNLRGYLQPVYDIPRSASAVFRVVERIPRELAAHSATCGAGEVDAVFGHSMSITPVDKHPSIAAAKIKLLTMSGRYDEARQELRMWRGRFGAHPELQSATELVAQPMASPA